MTLADVPVIYENVESQAHPVPWSQETLVKCIEVGFYAAVIEFNGELAGYGMISLAADESHILNFAIKPANQRQGLGERLVRHLIDVAKNRSIKNMFLEVRVSNISAMRLYEKVGFICIDRRKDYYDTLDKEVKEDAWVMKLELN